MRSFLQLAGLLQPSATLSSSSSPTQPGSSQPQALTMAVDFDPVEVLTQQQMADLAAFITDTTHLPPTAPNHHQQQARPAAKGVFGAFVKQPATLPWPRPHGELRAKQRLAIATHAQLYGYGTGAVDGRGVEEVVGRAAARVLAPGAVAAAAQRPRLRGPHAAKVIYITCLLP